MSMNMTPDHEDFHDLRRLLALKRHEQPPPGYFDRFSSEVIERIVAKQRLSERSLAERLFGPNAMWLRRLTARFQASPLLAGTFGATACALLVCGIVYSESSGPLLTTNVPLLTETTLAQTQPPVPAPSVNQAFFGATTVADNPTTGYSPDLQPNSLFKQIPAPQLRPELLPASFQFQQP
jgi:hypothetical protein